MREAGERSASVAGYLRMGIAPATRRTYTPAVEHYRQYCESRDWDPEGPITSFTAEEWLAALADGGRLMFSTICTYKAALSTHHEERSTAPNPFSSGRISRLLTGIEADKAPREATARRAKPKSDGFTLGMLKPIIAHYHTPSAKEVLFLGAAALLLAGGARPGEVLPAANRPQLLAEQLLFFAKAGDRSPITNPADLPSGSYPDHCILSLRGSKTNRQQRVEDQPIAQPDAVRALWRWRLRRHADSRNAELGAELFKLPGQGPLRIANLLAFLSLSLRATGQGDPHLTGKCFRIGATSQLAAAGAGVGDLRALGRWSQTSQVWQTYADPRSRQVRAREVNRRM